MRGVDNSCHCFTFSCFDGFMVWDNSSCIY